MQVDMPIKIHITVKCTKLIKKKLYIKI